MNWFDIIKSCCPHGKPEFIKPLADAMPMLADKYQISTPIRQVHFLAQMAQECDGFRTMHEYDSGAAYQGRKDLGNTHPGDGIKFKGRGYPQLTGRYNYDKYGQKLGVDLIKTPERAADPETSVRIAGAYWADHRLNDKADRDDLHGVTMKVNGGLNGIQTRETYLARFKAAMGGAPNPAVITEPIMSAAEIRMLQQRLYDLGYAIVGKPDGQIGPMTISAISQFQVEHNLPVTGKFDRPTVDSLWSATKKVIPDERANGTPPAPPVVKGTVHGAIATGGAGLVALLNWLFSQLQDFGSQWSAIKSALGPFGEIPDVISDHWGLIVVAFAIYVAYQARQMRKDQITAYRTGKII